MILPGGGDYPGDYAVVDGRDARGRAVYRVGDGPPRQYERRQDTGRVVVPYDDHPVVRAYRDLISAYDETSREHRAQYLSFIALALPGDDWDILSATAPRVISAISELNSMDDEDALMRRLEAAERRQDAIEVEMNDDARAQGDAMQRTGTGAITCEVEQ